MRPYDWARLKIAIRNMMNYWYARMILGRSSSDSTAFACGVHPLERRAITAHWTNVTYHRLRRQGLSWAECHSRMHGETVEAIKARDRRGKQALKQRWGGFPRTGTAAHARWLLAR